jgi:hypothetical protein
MCLWSAVELEAQHDPAVGAGQFRLLRDRGRVPHAVAFASPREAGLPRHRGDPLPG